MPSDDDDLIFIGYTHASIIGVHRPDVAYPDRKIRRGKKSYGDIHSEMCPCADKHVEVWVSRE
jgi:hypothetical protein